jgi:hypothetical protein
MGATQKQQLVALLVSLLAMGGVLLATRWRPASDVPADPRLAALYGQDGLALLRDHQRWEAWLLRPGAPGEDGAFLGRAAQGGALIVRGDGFAGLLDLLLDPRTYGEGQAGRCGHAPRIGFRFQDGPRELAFVFCVDCDQVHVPQPDGAAQVRAVNRSALLPHFKRLWPRDPSIQALQE